MHYTDFNSGLDGEDFRPSDIVDVDETLDPEDEILAKFKSQPEYQPKIKSKIQIQNHVQVRDMKYEETPSNRLKANRNPSFQQRSTNQLGSSVGPL